MKRLLYLVLTCTLALTGCGGGGRLDFGDVVSSTFTAQGWVRTSTGSWSSGSALEGVQVRVDTGQWTLTAQDGFWKIPGIASGSRSFGLSKEGYESVELVGEILSSRVQLPVYQDVNNRTRLWVRVHGYSSGNVWYSGSAVQVTRSGDPGRRWTVYWDDGPLSPSAVFSGVEKGASYELQVFWSAPGGRNSYASYGYTVGNGDPDVLDIWP